MTIDPIIPTGGPESGILPQQHEVSIDSSTKQTSQVAGIVLMNGAVSLSPPIPVSRSDFPTLENPFPEEASMQMVQVAAHTLTDSKDVIGNESVSGSFDIPDLHDASSDLDGQVSQVTEEAINLIEQGDWDDVDTLLTENLPKEVGGKVLVNLLNNCALKGDTKTYSKLLNVAEELIPNLNTYVENPQRGSVKKENPSIGFEGMKILRDHLVEKGSLQMECPECESIKDFINQLDALKNESGDVKMGFMVRNQGNPMLSPGHMTPIYVEKSGDKIDIVMTDSVANPKGNHIFYSMFLSNQITQKTGIEPYVLIGQRQHSPTNCTIFTLRDLVHISKNPKFMDFVKNSHKDVSEYPTTQGLKAKMFDTLPPEMMKVTQSGTAIKKYINENPELAAKKMASSKKAEGETIGEAFERHLGKIKGKDGKERSVNTLIAQRFEKYERVIIAKLLKEIV